MACDWDKHDWAEVGPCDHREELGVLATAVRCRACGEVGHTVKRYDLPRKRRRTSTRERVIQRERAACPIWEELQAQLKAEHAGEEFVPAAIRPLGRTG